MVATFARSTAKVAAEKYDFPTNRDLSLLHNAPGSSDVVLHIGPDRKRLYAHEHILTLSSAYFGRMLDRESFFREAQTRIVHKPNWSWEVAFALTRFMYTGRLDDVPVDILGHLYCAADEAQVEILVAEMRRRERDFLFMLRDPASAEDLLRFALISNLEVLTRTAATYLELLVGNFECRRFLYPPADCRCNWVSSADEDEEEEPPQSKNDSSSERLCQRQGQQLEVFASSKRQVAPHSTLVLTSGKDTASQPHDATISPDLLEHDSALTSPERLRFRGLPDVHQQFCLSFWLSAPSRPQPYRNPRTALPASTVARWQGGPRQFPMPSPKWDDLPQEDLSITPFHLPYQRMPLPSGAHDGAPFVSMLVIENVPVSSELVRSLTEGAGDDPVPHIAFKSGPTFYETISLEAAAVVGHAPRVSAYTQKTHTSPLKPSGKEAVASLLSDLRKHTAPQKALNPARPPILLTYVFRRWRREDMLQLMLHFVDKANPVPIQEELRVANAAGMSHPTSPLLNPKFQVRLNLRAASADAINAASLRLRGYGCKFDVFNGTKGLIEGRPAQIRRTMVLLEESLWKDANLSSRSSYDAKGTLIIYSPQRAVMLRIFDTQERLKCDFIRNCLIFDRSLEELKRVLADLDCSVFKDGNVNVVSSPSLWSPPMATAAQRSLPQHPADGTHSNHHAGRSQGGHNIHYVEWSTCFEPNPCAAPTGTLSRLSVLRAAPVSPSVPPPTCTYGWANTSAEPSRDPKGVVVPEPPRGPKGAVGPRGAQNHEHHSASNAGSTSAEVASSMPSSSALPSTFSSSLAAKSRSWGGWSVVGGGRGPGRRVITMPQMDDSLFGRVIQPGLKPGSSPEKQPH